MKPMKKGTGYVVLILILLVLGAATWYAGTILSTVGVGESRNIKLGLDLKGGVSITYQTVEENPSDEDMSDTIYKLQKRVESYSTEAQVYQEGSNRICIEIPGVTDANTILEELGSPGSLYFITQYDSDGNLNYSYSSTEGCYVLNYDLEDLIENGSVILSGSDVKSASAVYQTSSTITGGKTPVVQMTFQDEAVDIFATATTEAAYYGRSIAIYYDGTILSAPTVSSAITDGSCVIQNIGSYEEASALATYVRIGSLSLELTELHSKVLGAQLGEEALSTSLLAALIGLALVMLFMICFYRVPGFAASIALVFYCALMIYMLWIFDITLTLPGIAGIILSIGMAVDANVIIFARIREEIALGRPVDTAIHEGFHKATSAIVDGNITTLIAAIVLALRGSGSVKGFAYTLGIGIVVSMFTALVVTRWLMKCFYAMGFQKELFYGKQKERKSIPFLRHRTLFIAISVAVMLAGVVTMGIYAKTTGDALNYSLDFKGGSSTTVTFDTDYTLAEISEEMVPLIEAITGDSEVQTQKIEGSTQVVFKTRTLNLEEREAFNAMLLREFGVEESQISSENISATVSGEMKSDAIWAVAIATLCMLVYIWFRFKDLRFAGSAVLALVHDVLIVLAFYAFTRISVGNTFIACMLTIVGYSINATIVIFDRIRENLKSLEYETPENLLEVTNRSITQTLSRSINTSLTTFLMVFVLWILGVSSIKEFALPLIAGIVCGTYSSVCITGGLWYFFKLRIKSRPKPVDIYANLP